MSDIVFILGAGASADCGGPLMNSFLKTAWLLMKANKLSPEDLMHFETVFGVVGGLQIVHSKSQLDLENIESIFTALEMANIIQTLPKQATNPQDAIKSLVYLITRTLELSIHFTTGPNGFLYPTSTYSKFADLLHYLKKDASPAYTSSVITFNYDIAVDVAINHLGWECDYRLGGQRRDDAQIQVLKLHGSLNWATSLSSSSNNGPAAIEPLRIADYVQMPDKFVKCSGGRCTTTIGSKLAELMPPPWNVTTTVPVIVPPAWNKSNHHSALTHVWAAASRELSEARHIFVIGYSLPETDAFFKLLYALGSVGEHPLSRFVVFNPDRSTQVDSRFRSLLGPGALACYECRPLTFFHAICDIYEMFPGNVSQQVLSEISNSRLTRSHAQC